jgi:hypothetical protein
MIGAKMATLKDGQRKGSSNDLAQDDAASLLSVSLPTVKRAKYVLEHGSTAQTKVGAQVITVIRSGARILHVEFVYICRHAAGSVGRGWG